MPALTMFDSFGHVSAIWTKSGSFVADSGKPDGKTVEVVSVTAELSMLCADCPLGFKPSVASEKVPGGFDSHPLPLKASKPGIVRVVEAFLFFASWPSSVL